MIILFEVLILVSAILLVIGLIRPSMLKYLGGSATGERKRITIIYGFFILMFAMLLLVEKDHEQFKQKMIHKPAKVKSRPKIFKGKAAKTIQQISLIKEKVAQPFSQKNISKVRQKTYPMPNAKKYFQGEPKYVLACFLQRWRQENWRKMLDYSDRDWVRDNNDSMDILKSMFAKRKLLGAVVSDILIQDDLLTEIKLKLFYSKNDSSGIIEKYRDVRLVKADLDSKWGVYPPSIIKDVNYIND